MNPAVRRLLDQREQQGLGRHVEDDGTLDMVATLLLNATTPPTKSGVVQVTRTTCPHDRKKSRGRS